MLKIGYGKAEGINMPEQKNVFLLHGWPVYLRRNILQASGRSHGWAELEKCPKVIGSREFSHYVVDFHNDICCIMMSLLWNRTFPWVDSIDFQMNCRPNNYQRRGRFPWPQSADSLVLAIRQHLSHMLSSADVPIWDKVGAWCLLKNPAMIWIPKWALASYL